MLTGSFASSIHGVPRMTLDADIVADINASQAEQLAELLGGDFYVDVEMIEDAVEQRTSFNLIHLDSMFKVDVFVLAERPLDRSGFQERQKAQFVSALPEEVFVATPEFIIVKKLEWYEAGGRVSDQQYRDVLGVIEVQTASGTLDWVKMEKWVRDLGLASLLEQARGDAESTSESN